MSATTSLLLAFIFVAIFGLACRSIGRYLKKINESQSQNSIWALHGLIILALISLVLSIYFAVISFTK